MTIPIYSLYACATVIEFHLPLAAESAEFPTLILHPERYMALSTQNSCNSELFCTEGRFSTLKYHRSLFGSTKSRFSFHSRISQRLLFTVTDRSTKKRCKQSSEPTWAYRMWQKLFLLILNVWISPHFPKISSTTYQKGWVSFIISKIIWCHVLSA